MGTIDPLGGINSLWPLFGIANQMLAAIALCVATTVIVKSGKARHAWVTALPLVWVVAVTSTAAWQKLFSPKPSIAFLALAHGARQGGSPLSFCSDCELCATPPAADSSRRRGAA